MILNQQYKPVLYNGVNILISSFFLLITSKWIRMHSIAIIESIQNDRVDRPTKDRARPRWLWKSFPNFWRFLVFRSCATCTRKLLSNYPILICFFIHFSMFRPTLIRFSFNYNGINTENSFNSEFRLKHFWQFMHR